MDLFRVPLSSIDQNPTQIGDRAAKLLLKRIESGSKSRPTRILVPVKLIVRDSSAMPSTEEELHKVGVLREPRGERGGSVHDVQSETRSAYGPSASGRRAEQTGY